MKFHAPLLKGTLIKRYKRFMADVTLEDGSEVTAHCANSGSMLSVNDPGAEVWLSPAKNPDRKLKFTWEMIRIKRALVGINTQHPNGLVADAIEDGTITELQGFEKARREVKYGKNSRIDILLGEGEDALQGPRCYVEVKNVTMRRDLTKGAPAEFPDGVTARGAKHLVELSDMVKEGHRAVMIYLVQRGDADEMVIARDIDPTYGETLDKARKAGVEVLAYKCKLTSKSIRVTEPVAFLD
ncbi:MAG: DNA/RNA nuclease SfsA [Rhodospirillaceae bacterium]|nr:DNA/RNA nuclease SfsA [Rhodospirillaceae bacterium]MBT3909298.1 DNA/RNA nuclease SfsA [Rhodospirillaceae bacterium]